jgi:hypothetical protein
MSDIDRAREALRDYYADSLRRRLDQVVAWRDGFDAADDDLISEVRRAGHQLRGTAASYGFPLLSDLGGEVEVAPVAELPRLLGALVEEVRSALAGLAPPRP